MVQKCLYTVQRRLPPLSLCPEATTVSTFLGSFWGRSVRRCKYFIVEVLQPPSQLHKEFPIAALQFWI